MVKIKELPKLTLDRTDLMAVIHRVQTQHAMLGTVMAGGQPKIICTCGQGVWSIQRHQAEEIAEATTKWFTQNIGELVVQEAARYHPASQYEEGIVDGHVRASSLIGRLGRSV